MDRLNARERARRAANEYKRKQAERQKQVAATVAAYFRADSRAGAAREKLAAADEARAEAIAAMIELGESVETIAGLCGIDAAEVRALRRQARKRAAVADGGVDVPEEAAPPDEGESDGQ